MTLLLFLMYVCIHIYVFVCCVGIPVHVCMCMWKQRSVWDVILWMASSLLNLLRQTFSLAWGLLIWLYLSASEPQLVSVSSVLRSWVPSTVPSFFMWVLGNWAQDFMLSRQTLYWLSYLTRLFRHSTKFPQLPPHNSNTYQERKLLELLSTLTTPQV